MLRGALFALVFVAGSASAQQEGDRSCLPSTVKAIERDAVAYGIYRTGPDFFASKEWWSCPDRLTSLTVALHETVHYATTEKKGYPLSDGSFIPESDCADEGLLRPTAILIDYDRSKLNVGTYLVPVAGADSSATKLCVLLDETNAYTHGLRVALAFRSMTAPGQESSHRDGTVAMMAFLKSYAEAARAGHARTWQALNREPLRSTVRKIWNLAEKTLASSCGVPGFGIQDAYYYSKLCDGRSGAIATIVGAPPACRPDCLPASE